MERKKIPDHPVELEGKKYVREMTPDQKEQHKMAQEMLGSSYFVERTKGYKEWAKAQKK
jgi:hypothetical protein